MLSGIETWTLQRCGIGSFQELEAWQEQAYQKQAEQAKKSSFYREGLHGFTTSEDLRQDPLRFLCIPPKEVSRITTLPTSGTSGTPKRIYFSEEDLELTAEYFEIGMQELMRPREKAAIFMPGATPGSVGELLIRAIHRFGGEAEAFGFIRDPREAISQAETADCLLGQPTQLLVLSRFAPHLRPKSILLTGDPVSSWLLTELEQTWGCRTHPHYGLTESGFGLAVRGQDGRSEQICHPFIRLEIIDPQTSNEVPEGEWGEIVLSTLQRTAMPLLRYRTGDWGRFSPGFIPKRLDIRQSRIDQPLYANEFSVHQLDEMIFAHREILNYSATLRKNELELTLDSKETSATLENLLRDHLNLSIPWKITIKPLLCDPGKRKINIEE